MQKSSKSQKSKPKFSLNTFSLFFLAIFQFKIFRLFRKIYFNENAKIEHNCTPGVCCYYFQRKPRAGLRTGSWLRRNVKLFVSVSFTKKTKRPIKNYKTITSLSRLLNLIYGGGFHLPEFPV